MNLGPLAIDNADKCWLWQGAKNNNGYGTASHEGRPTGAHRYVYELVRGAIPDRHVLDHQCKNRACANPYHLEAVTNAENVRRGDLHNRRKTTCPQGHAYDAVHRWKDSRSGLVVEARRCTTCRREQAERKAVRRREG